MSKWKMHWLLFSAASIAWIFYCALFSEYASTHFGLLRGSVFLYRYGHIILPISFYFLLTLPLAALLKSKVRIGLYHAVIVALTLWTFFGLRETILEGMRSKKFEHFRDKPVISRDGTGRR